MQTVLRTLGCGAGVALGLLLVTAVHGQAPRGVHRMEVNNGASQTVRYFSMRLSPGESAALRDLERSENDLIYVRNLQALKQQYVADERMLETQRNLAQQQMYNVAMMPASSYGAFWGPSGSGTLAAVSEGYGYPSAYTYPAGFGLGGLYAYGGGYGRGDYGAGVAGLGNASLLAANLGYGVSDERTLKDALVSVVAKEASAEFATLVERNNSRALAQVASSPKIRVALGLPDGSRMPSAFVKPAAAEGSDPYVITLKDGTTISGPKMEETKEWIIIITNTGRKVRVRPADVTRIDEGKSGGVGPAN